MTLPTFRELKDDINALRKGQKRVAPYGSRGRVYSDPPGTGGGSVLRAKAQPIVKVSINRIYSKELDEWFTEADWPHRFDIVKKRKETNDG